MEEWLLPPPPHPLPSMRGRMGAEAEIPLKYPRVQSHKNERQKGGKLFSKECPFFSMASVILPPYPVRAVVLYPFPGGGGRSIPSPFSRLYFPCSRFIFNPARR
ncbi:hypothetical protein CDAR_604341 [Caerostris darwini]|uniref:Uncharacterized protein n=1 Tax=Caerostris darwini TaxID=1538125 RepID=A0AAV4T002_9ARAC|nr:hypothetical protein CDAR_604341 [Caerostris darwini]